jgi:hypothetical protein
MTALTVVSAAGSPPSPPSRATGSGERSAHAPAGAVKGFGEGRRADAGPTESSQKGIVTLTS